MAKATITIDTPTGVDKPGEVKAEEIPLPPEAMWKELDNSGAAPAAASAVQAAVAPPIAPRPREQLDFVGDAHAKVIPLDHAFRRDGRLVDKIWVRRLTIGEVGDLIDSLPKGFDNFEIYAAMTGYPAAVLRGLMDVDGEQVTGACYDFLPRIFRPREEAGSSSTQEPGA